MPELNIKIKKQHANNLITWGGCTVSLSKRQDLFELLGYALRSKRAYLQYFDNPPTLEDYEAAEALKQEPVQPVIADIAKASEAEPIDDKKK